MGSRVKGLTIELGGDVKGLDKALSGINKDINKTQSELKDVERLLKMDPTNTELLEQKQRLLADAVSETGGKLETLKEAEKQVQQQFERGDIGQEQYDRLRREIIQTESRLDGFKAEAKAADKAVRGIDSDSVKDVDRAADQAGDALQDAGKDAADFGDVLTAGAIVEGVKGIVDAVKDLHEETAEYRKILGTLDVSSESAGYSATQTEEAYKRLYGVLGDDQSTATTLANLQAIGVDQQKLMKLIDDTTGAWARYGDSIPIDGLAESVNESTKAGRVTGVLADVINWGAKEGETYGIAMRAATEENEAWNKAVQECTSAEDYFNLALQNCSTEAERADLIMQAMADQGLGKMAQSWRANNDDIVAANEAQSEYMENAAKIAEKADPAMIAAKEGMADAMGKMADAMDQIDMEKTVDLIDKFFTIAGDGLAWMVENNEVVLAFLISLTTALGAIKGLGMVAEIGKMAEGINAFATAFPGAASAIMSFLSNPYVLLIAAVIALVALVGLKGDEIKQKLSEVDQYMQGIFAKDWGKIFGPVLGAPVRAFQNHLKSIWDGIMLHANAAITFWQDVFAGNWKKVWQEDVLGVFSAIWNQMVNVVKGPVNLIIGMINGMLSAVVTGVNLVISALNKIPGVSIGTITAPTIPFLANGGILDRGSAIVGEAGPELLTMNHGRAVVQPLTAGGPGIANSPAAVGYSGPETIVVQSVLDGRIIGESAYHYGREAARAYGD